jgi:hypothetical protein
MQPQNINFSVRGQVRLSISRQRHTSEGMMSKLREAEADEASAGMQNEVMGQRFSESDAGNCCLNRRNRRRTETGASCYHGSKCKTRLCNKEQSSFSSDGQERVHFQTNIDFFGETDINDTHHFRQIQKHR